MRSVIFSSGLAAACLGLCHCALDDRSPSDAVASNQPGEGASAGASATAGSAPSSTAAGGSASVDGSPAVAGAAGVAMGMRPGSGGTSGGNAAGSSGAAGAGSMSMAPPVAPIDVPVGGSAPTSSGSCPAFTPCGGELVGSWAYTDVCPVAPDAPFCPDLTVDFAMGGAAGLAFANGQVARSGTPVGDSTIHFPASCLSFLACSDLPLLTQMASECSEEPGGCACIVPFIIDWGQQTYASTGTELRLGDGRTFDYCVEGDRLMYRETGDAKEPGVFTLQRN